jgi:hypothetical protein
MDTLKNTASTRNKTHSIVAWSLLAGLLFLRLPFLAGGVILFPKLDWLDIVFDIGTYLLTACLIWWERDRLADFHIDRLALSIIILFKPVQTIVLATWGFSDHPLTFPRWPSLILWGIAIGLLLALWLTRPRLPKFSKASFGWLGLGILAGLATVLLLGYPMSLQITPNPSLKQFSIFSLLLPGVRDFFYQLGYAAVTEEPLFRGFLWGYLRKAGWKNVWIWLFQTGLFMLGHIYYVTQLPISFWLIVPAGALVLGALAWRSKTISSSLAAHATLNAFGHTVGSIIASYR